MLLSVWAITIPACFIFGWWNSVPFVAFASIYANMATHWGAWQAARTEVKEDTVVDEDTEDIDKKL